MRKEQCGVLSCLWIEFPHRPIPAELPWFSWAGGPGTLFPLLSLIHLPLFPGALAWMANLCSAPRFQVQGLKVRWACLSGGHACQTPGLRATRLV